MKKDQKEDKMNECYTPSEAAKILKVSRQYIWSLLERDRLEIDHYDTKGSPAITHASIQNYLLLRINELKIQQEKYNNLLKSMQNVSNTY